MKPRLLLDSDCILSDFVRPCLDILERLMGKTYAREDVTAYDIMKSLDIPEDIAQQAYQETREEGFCKSLPVCPGAQEGVARLQKCADVFIVTAPLGGLFWEGERAQWLYDHFGIGRKNVVSTSAKFIISGDVFVDDKTIALGVWEKWQPGWAVQWETPHNRNDGWMGSSTKNWDELMGMVKATVARQPTSRSNPFNRMVPGSGKAI